MGEFIVKLEPSINVGGDITYFNMGEFIVKLEHPEILLII